MTSMPPAKASPVESAVLAPVYRDEDGDVHLVLIVRQPGGAHGGQVALPGGKREREDRDLQETALREAEEEIGLRRQQVRILATLPIVETMTTGFRIAPFLGQVESPLPSWKLQRNEVAAVLDVLLSDMARPEAHGEQEWHFFGWTEPRVAPYYQVGEHKLWGATYRIVHPLLPRLLAEEWNIAVAR